MPITLHNELLDENQLWYFDVGNIFDFFSVPAEYFSHIMDLAVQKNKIVIGVNEINPKTKKKTFREVCYTEFIDLLEKSLIERQLPPLTLVVQNKNNSDTFQILRDIVGRYRHQLPFRSIPPVNDDDNT